MENYALTVVNDPEPMNPRDTKYNENLGTMACFHRRYNLGDERPAELRSDFFSGWDAMESYIETTLRGVAILPIYMYDHSGITIRTYRFECPWDSGQIGFIYTTREDVLKWCGWKRLTAKRLAKVRAWLIDEVASYDRYLSGEAYGYVIRDSSGDSVDSCWGYESEEAARAEGEYALKHLQGSGSFVPSPDLILSPSVAL